MVKSECYIKRVHMEGFRSYKDQVDDLEDFHKGVNVIVGKNGSGKSNFFLAIKFVLSDAYSNVRPEEKRRLLHESSGAESTTLSARVEIVFDNSDGRFPVDKEEIVLRRDIGYKKDEYYLDNLQIKKADVNNLLESAGFSRANPYYIVQQGKVAALTNMKDADRLELLKEVAGTRVYDERKAESIKIMNETADKVEKVDEMLEYITQRLEELEQEKEELKEYQTLDTKKRALEYAMYDQELHDAQAKLVQYDEERTDIVAEAQGHHDASIKNYDAIRVAEKKLKEITNALRACQDKKDILENEKRELLRVKAKKDIEVSESKDKVSRENTRVKELTSQLKDIEAAIEDRTKKLETAKQQYQTAIKAETDTTQQVTNHERRLTDLYAKQGQSKVYKTAADRDKALQKEINGLETEVTAHNATVTDLTKEVAQSKDSLVKNSKSKTEIQTKVESLLKEIEKAQKELLVTKDRRDEASNERKKLWREEDEIKTKYNNLVEQINKNKYTISSSMPKALSAGYAHVFNIVRQNPNRFPEGKKVFGPLIDLFSVDKGYETAVEVIAGNSLFFYVVDTDETAAELLELLQAQKSCRISFIPLNISTVSFAIWFLLRYEQNNTLGKESKLSRSRAHDVETPPFEPPL